MDDQFLFRSRGDVYVKGMRTPMRCHLLSRNLSKVAKVQMLLESGLIVGAGTPSPTCSPCDGGGKYRTISNGHGYQIWLRVPHDLGVWVLSRVKTMSYKIDTCRFVQVDTWHCYDRAGDWLVPCLDNVMEGDIGS